MSAIQNGIEVFMIWAVLESESDAPWLVDSWDEFSIDGNYDGWEKAIAKAKAENEEICITKTVVDYGAVQAIFAPAAIKNNGIKESN